MKKYITLLIFILIITINPANQVYAAGGAQNAEISKIESNLYGFDYVNDKLQNRIERLEKTVYGQASTGDLSARLKKLAADISADQIGLEITPSEDTFDQENQIADNTVEYPIVDEIEMKLFNQTFKNKDFHSRIVAIERKMFGKIYDVDDYSTRMDRIKTEIMPETLATDSNRFNYDDNALSSMDLSGINSSRYGSMPYGQQNYTRPYANYGDYSFDDMAANPNINDELAQLEYSTFGTEFSNEDTRSRLKRLNSVNKAKKSKGRYDSQKFQQHLSTAMEIGAMLLMILAMVL